MSFGKLPLDLRNHITAKSNEIKIKDELQGKKTIISRIDYIAKNENVLGANSLNNEIERIVDNFNSLKLSDILDIALNKENVRDNIALTTKANEVNIQVNNWINNNIVNLTVDDSLGNGKGKLDKADLTSLQNKAAPATLSKIYEIGVDTKAKLLKKVLADNAADLSKASKNITEKNITDAIQNNFNAEMKVLTPGTKDFSKEQIVKFLNVISDAKIKAVLKEVKTAKAASAPVAAPIIVVAGGPSSPPPLPTRVIGYNGLGMDGLVRKMNILKPIENLFPKKPDADAGEVVYIAPTSELGKKYEDAVKVIAASDDKFKKELAIKTKGKEKLKALIVEEVFEKYTTKNADALDGDINQLAQAIKEGTNIEFIGPKREVESGIDQETRNLCVRMNQDAGLMQQLKTNNPRLAAIIEAAAVNEEEVATRLPESAAAQAVANGDVNYGGVVVVAPATAPVAPVAPLVLPRRRPGRSSCSCSTGNQYGRCSGSSAAGGRSTAG
ncbi:MAG: hypothetical protein LN590_03055 [Rickettsia endosymbiont of Glossina mortisans submortisans]|nr:hypothetical protein [Rickettsia endosymbiont of Glossina mortisans submortisans]